MLNLLNNARNSMVDNFQSIKWIFHEIEEIKIRMQEQEGKEGEDGAMGISKLDEKVTEMEKEWKGWRALSIALLTRASI